MGLNIKMASLKLKLRLMKEENKKLKDASTFQLLFAAFTNSTLDFKSVECGGPPRHGEMVLLALCPLRTCGRFGIALDVLRYTKPGHSMQRWAYCCECNTGVRTCFESSSGQLEYHIETKTQGSD